MGEWMTYERMGELTGRGTEGARQLARRLNLPRRRRNVDEKTEVLVDLTQPGIAKPDGRADQAPGQPGVQRPVQPPGQPGNHLQELVDTLRAERDRTLAEIERLRAEYAVLFAQHRADHATELKLLRNEIERARLEADRAHEALDREREHSHDLVDQLRQRADQIQQLYQERQTDAEVKANLIADLNHATIELDRRQTPWWRRLMTGWNRSS
jgi:DNA repair exonuclease SbcCD ATPase subunit